MTSSLSQSNPATPPKISLPLYRPCSADVRRMFNHNAERRKSYRERGPSPMHPICGGGRASLRKHHHSTADADDEADLMPILEDEIVNGLESSGLTACHDLSTEERSTVKRKKSSLCLILRVFLVSLLFLISVSLGLFCLYTYMTTCSSSKCAMSSARLLANMDLDADPCEDFYQYSCGMWINQTVNLNYPSWNSIYKTYMAAHDRTIMTILAASENQLPFELSEGEKSAVKVFRQCTDGNGQLAIGKKPLIDLMESLGGWMPDLVLKEPKVVAVFDTPRSPMVLMAEETDEEKTVRARRDILYSPLEDELLTCFNLSVFPLFFGGVQVSYVNSSEYIITIYPQVPLLMRSDIYRGPTPTVESILEGTSNSQIVFLLYTVGQEVADILGLESPDLRRRIAEMIVLEWKITNCWPTETELENDLYKIRTLDDLHKLSPALDWQYFFSKLTGLSLSRMEPIAFKSGVEWMEKLSIVLEEYTSTVEKQLILRSYLKWKVAMFYISYIKEEHGHPTTWLMTQLLTGPPHLKKEFCFMRLSGIFPLSLPSILRKADGHGRVTKNRDAALTMAERIREEYLEVARSTDVLDDYTRDNVLKKLTNMSIKASYPDKIDIPEELQAEADRVGSSLFESMIIGTVAVYRKSIGRLRSPVDQRDWIDTRPALSSVPVLNYERNMVLLPMDILYAPMHDAGQVDSLNYGILGSTIGHEMTHAFDDEGKQHGPTGNLGDRNWWSSASKQRYRELEKCVIDHYVNFTKNPDMAYKARYETVADLVGVDVAFKAWKKNGRDVWKQLPGLDLSPEQRFFVAYAQGWCAQPIQGNAEKHYSEKPRVLGSLRNSPLFAKVFSCKPNTFMNPTNKCRIW